MIEYKGYLGKFELDVKAELFAGEVAGLRDVITFQGKTPAELVKSFHDSVDDYLEFCASRGESPDKPFSGKFLVRTDPELHRRISAIAEARGQSVNAWINDRIIEQTTGLLPPLKPARKMRKAATAATSVSPGSRKA